MATRRTRTTTRVEVASDRGVFMISVAAELADMHPQTLRMYEQRGLIEPKRSPKGTRLFSHADVEVPTLHGTKKLRVPPGTRHGTVQRLRGEGPPVPGSTGKGDIHYRFVIDVPPHLSDEQRRVVDELSKVMNGNPRERILREAGRGAA